MHFVGMKTILSIFTAAREYHKYDIWLRIFT